MEKTKHASIEFSVGWQGPHATHVDRHHFDKINYWRDFFPGNFAEKLSALPEGGVIKSQFDPSDLQFPYSEKNLHTVSSAQIQRHIRHDIEIAPHRGRFYPRGIVSGVPDTYPQDRRPFRYLGHDDAKALIDFNHPLAQFPLTWEAKVVEIRDSNEEHGGRCNDIVQDITGNGPGLQTSRADMDTDFFSGNPFARLDSREDLQFYNEPRLVHHVDAIARRQISELYARFLKPGMKVLDLMSSWNSHIPDGIDALTITGLGMNREELATNERLSELVIHDLNQNPALPFNDTEFDAAICTVSVEYLTQPIDVFDNVARVLKAKAPFIVTFSERWFPPKVIKLWMELHPFERMGLVVEYYRKAGKFEDIHTESLRGLFRPEDDKYIRMTPFSDPVYAVSGKVRHPIPAA